VTPGWGAVTSMSSQTQAPACTTGSRPSTAVR
jgi:hypothetical protein